MATRKTDKNAGKSSKGTAGRAAETTGRSATSKTPKTAPAKSRSPAANKSTGAKSVAKPAVKAAPAKSKARKPSAVQRVVGGLGEAVSRAGEFAREPGALERVVGGITQAVAVAGEIASAARSVTGAVGEIAEAGQGLMQAGQGVAHTLFGDGGPQPSTAPYGQAGKALDGVRILDFTHVQSGPTCTQLLAWFGADVIKVERPSVGDITRGQLRDVPNADSLYFTMLNHNKRSITIDSKNPKGKEILERLVRECDVLVENFAPGALDRMGFTWEHIHEINPRMIVASVKGFGPGPYEDCKVYENVAQCAGGSASTTGFRDGPPLVTGAQIGDSGTGLHLALGIVCALYQRNRTGRGQKVLAAMQDGVLNLCRVKLRDQQRLTHGPLTEYSQYGENIPFGDAVPRAGNDSGGGQPGWILKCKGWEEDPNAYIYFITQAPVWEKIADLIGKPEWKTDPDYAKPPARLPRLRHIFDTIEEWTKTQTKFEVMEKCNALDIPVGPILSMKEIAEEPSLRETGTVVEVDHPTRGKYLTVGNPIKMSDSISEVTRSPLLGEHTDEILRDVLGYSAADIDSIKGSGAIAAPEKKAAQQAEAKSVAVE